jgi:hypothetical protein
MGNFTLPGLPVHLEKHESEVACFVGKRRYESSRRDGKQHTRGYTATGLKSHMRGEVNAAAAEIAVGKLLNVYVPLSFNVKGEKPDVGRRIQVRHTLREDNSLIIIERSVDDQFFVLVTGSMPEYSVKGYIRAKEGKLEEYIRNPDDRGEAYFVPQSALTPIEDLVQTRRTWNAEWVVDETPEEAVDPGWWEDQMDQVVDEIEAGV